MRILPAIDLKDQMCVRLVKGDYATAHKVAEDAVEGYAEPEIRREGNTFILTNTCSKPDEPDTPPLPDTGLLWWPVPVLTALGLLCLVVGLLRRRGGRHEE